MKTFLKKLISDENNNISSRRFTAMICLILFIGIVIIAMMKDIQINVLYSVETMIVTTLGLSVIGNKK